MKPFANAPADFEVIERPTGEVLLHRSEHVWIVHYDTFSGPHPAVYRAYRAVERVPKGRWPWTVDNRAIGSRDGVLTLAEAVALARDSIKAESVQRAVGDLDALQ
jgi:hypothetical protein